MKKKSVANFSKIFFKFFEILKFEVRVMVEIKKNKIGGNFFKNFFFKC